MQAPHRIQFRLFRNSSSAEYRCGRCQREQRAAQSPDAGCENAMSTVELGCPVAERASRRRNTARSLRRGSKFLIPIQAICSGGRETPRSAFPSLVQTTKPPVSAIAKLTPVSPASAAQNRSRRCWRAASVRYAGSESAFFRTKMFVKTLADLFFPNMNCGQHNMAGRFLLQLNNSFTQVSIDDLNPLVFEKRIKMTFFSQHGFAFDDAFYTVLLQDLVNYAVMFSSASPPSAHEHPGLGLCVQIVRDNPAVVTSRAALSLMPARRSSHSGTFASHSIAFFANEPECRSCHWARSRSAVNSAASSG